MRAPGEPPSKADRPPLELSEPSPPAPGQVWRVSAQAATIGLFVMALIAALYLGRPILLPIVSAFVVTMMLGPLSARADRAGIPSLVTAIVLWVLTIAVVYGVIILVAAPAVDWIDKAPEIGRNLQEKLHVLDRPLAALHDLRSALLPGEAGQGVGFDIVSVVSPVVGVVTPAIGQMIIFFGMLFFMLLGRMQLRQVTVAFFRQRAARLRCLKIMNDIEHNLTGYLSVVSVINTVVGIMAGCVAWAVGLPDPVAWGVLAFVLNYVPYIGAFIVELGMFMVGLVTFETLTHAAIGPLAFLALATLEGHFVTPSVLGRRFTMNPLTVFTSLVFWTWLWGPVGAFLAAPLLIMSLVAVAHLYPKHAPDLPE